MMTPAQKNRAVAGLTFPGRCCIFTIAAGPYRALKPLFVRLAKRAYPEYEVMAMDLDVDPHRARCMRFLWDGGLKQFDYVLITDIDILIAPENPDIVTQHMRSMTVRETGCYDNFTVGDTMPGVHFVTKAWWPATILAREQESGSIEGANLDYNYDERMLYRLVRNSGLRLPPALPIPWAHHGFHLGTYRNKKRLPENFDDYHALRHLEADPESVELYKQAADTLPWLKPLREAWNRRYNFAIGTKA